MKPTATSTPITEHLPETARPTTSNVPGANANNRGGNDGGYGLTEPPYRVPTGGTGPTGLGASGIIPGITAVPVMPVQTVISPQPDFMTRLTRQASDLDGKLHEGDDLMPKPIG